MYLEILNDILGYSGIGSSLLPILIIFKQNLCRSQIKYPKIIFVLSLFYAVFNVIILIFYLYYPIYEEALIKLYSIIEFLLITFFYSRIIQNIQLKKALTLISSIYSASILLSFFYFEINDNFLFLNIFQKVFLLVISLYYLHEIYNSRVSENLYDLPYFWCNTAILVFNASTIYVSVFENIIRNNDSYIFYILWPILQISGIAYYVLFSIGIWKLKD